MESTIHIIGMGKALPSNQIVNQRFEEIVETSDAWISQRTGIQERRFCAEQETSATLAVRASLQAIKDAAISATDVDLIICATVTPESTTPPNAARIMTALGCRSIPAFDLSAACTGFLFAMHVAQSLMVTTNAQTALVVGAEALSRCLDFEDRGSCILFGDGAGAVVLRRSSTAGHQVLQTSVATMGDQAELIRVPNNEPLQNCKTLASKTKRFTKVGLEGREVFRFAIETMQRCVEEAVETIGVNVSDIDLIVPHQVNTRVFDVVAERIDLTREKFYTNIEKYGNTSAASIPIALSEAAESGKLSKGDLVCLVAFGGGLSCGWSLIRW